MKAPTHTGESCPRCGDTERYDSSGGCVSCTKKASRSHRLNRASAFVRVSEVRALEARVAFLERAIGAKLDDYKPTSNTEPPKDPLLT